PVAIATAVATTLTRLAVGGGPLYGQRQFALVTQTEILAYCVLGILAGLLGPLFLAALSKAADAARKLPLPRVLVGTLGGLGVGALAIAFPQVTGNGYEAIQLILDAKLAGAILAALLIAKGLATISSVSSGTPGGVFTPSMFLGAALGGLVATAVSHLFGAHAFQTGGYALAGMAALVAATTHAPLMAATLAFELSGDYTLVIPLLCATALSVLISRRLREDSIYTEELRRRGIPWRGTLAERLARAVVARDILSMDPPQVAAGAKLAAAFALLSQPGVRVVYLPGKPLRALDLNDLKRLWKDSREHTASECAHEVKSLSPNDSLLDLAHALWDAEWGELPVVEGEKILGVVTRRSLLGALDAEVLQRDVLLTRVVRFEGEREADELFELPADRRIEEIAVPKAFQGQPLRQLHLRERFGVVALALRKTGSPHVEEIAPGQVLKSGDRLLVLGAPAAIDRLRSGIA
ncbi:MAG TPA: chloride channel protein, partial [Myxococcales bacterium]|nr:chloride channel protein [Myxococcales bacterium]